MPAKNWTFEMEQVRVRNAGREEAGLKLEDLKDKLTAATVIMEFTAQAAKHGIESAYLSVAEFISAVWYPGKRMNGKFVPAPKGTVTVAVMKLLPTWARQDWRAALAGCELPEYSRECLTEAIKDAISCVNTDANTGFDK